MIIFKLSNVKIKRNNDMKTIIKDMKLNMPKPNPINIFLIKVLLEVTKMFDINT